jgi:two-component system phosphate regulon sensor histidine kinase PhoR
MKRPEKTVAAVVAVALIILISVQIYWAKKNYNEAESVFNEKIDRVLLSVKDEMNDAVTCFELYSKMYVDSGEGIFMMKTKWAGKEEDDIWDPKVRPDSVPMFFNVPEEYKNSPLNKVYKDLKFSNPVTAEILFKFRYDMKGNSPDRNILKQELSINNFKDAIKNHEPLLAIYDTLMLDSLIKLRIRENNLRVNYSYALVKSNNDSIAYISNKAATGAIFGEGIRTRFTPDNLFSYPYDIILLANNKVQLILENILTVLLLSVGIIILLLFAYLYFMQIILRQKRLSEMKTDFINNMTHEFNTPIANISLAYETLVEKGKIVADPYSDKIVGIIQSETERLKDNVTRILNISSFEGNSATMKMESVTLSEVVDKAMSRLELKIRQREACINYIPPDERIEIKGDRIHLSGAIENLIDNALKYCNGSCRIDIKICRNGQGPEISISDNGIGMKKAELEKIFDKFYRAQHGNIQNDRGFGIGLNYVKQVIEAHGGKISVTSNPGEGSCFRIYFNKHEDTRPHSSRRG